MLRKTRKALDLQREMINLFRKTLFSVKQETAETPEIFILVEKLYQEAIVEIEGSSLSNNKSSHTREIKTPVVI